MTFSAAEIIKAISAGSRYAACLIVGILAGAFLGAWVERTRHDVSQFYGAIGQSFLLGQHAHLQYCNAEYDAAREAMLAWLSHLESMRPVNGEYLDPMMNERAITVDKALAFGRLALLEEKGEQPTRAREYWQRSEDAAKAASWTDTSETGIRSTIQRLDNCNKATAKP